MPTKSKPKGPQRRLTVAEQKAEQRKQNADRLEVRHQRRDPQTELPITEQTRVTSLARLAYALGVSLQTVMARIAVGMPALKDPMTGTYEVEPARKWLETYKRRPRASLRQADMEINKAIGDAKDERLALLIAKLEAEIAKLKQEARGKSLKNDEYEGLLLPADDVRQWIASRFLRIKSRLEQLPDELQLLAPASLRPQLHTDLTNSIHDLLLEMSSWETQARHTDMQEAG